MRFCIDQRETRRCDLVLESHALAIAIIMLVFHQMQSLVGTLFSVASVGVQPIKTYSNDNVVIVV